jgi:nucleoside-diphosphate-sugar epimerase
VNSPILVTGASGFLGTHLVNALVARGETVVTHSWEDGDLARVEPRVPEARHVYHLAARTYVPDSWSHPKDFYETNVLGTVGVLDYCRSRQASLTLISSYLYGQPERLPIDEDHPLRAFNPYGHSKLVAEEVARFYGQNFGVPVTVVRPFNLYGPGQGKDFLIPTLIRQALDPHLDVISVADHRPRRDYIYVGDLVRLLLMLSDRPGRAAGIYNAGSGHSTSVLELAESIVGIAGTRKPVVSRNEERQNEVLDTVADIGRARRELGWEPEVSLREGLERTTRAMQG